MQEVVKKPAYANSEAVADCGEWTIGDLLRNAVALCPDRVALTFLSDEPQPTKMHWSYAELLDRAEAVAHHLLQHFSPGEHVAVWSVNRPEWILLQHGAALAGLVLVTISPAARDADLTHIVRQSDAVALFHGTTLDVAELNRLLSLARDASPRLRFVDHVESFVAEAASTRAGATLPSPDPHAPAIIMFTSGTTGKAKGALLSHYTLVNSQRFFEHRVGLPHGSIWLNPSPLYTISGGACVNFGALWNEGTHILMSRFHPRLMVRGIEEFRANWSAFVPTMATMLLEYVETNPCDFSSLKIITIGGSAIAPSLADRFETVTGAVFCNTYGQTESVAMVTHCRPDESRSLRAASPGRALPGREIRIVDPSTGETLACGETGEICVRGLVMSGYYGMPEATAETLSADGWLRTGDLGELDANGYLTISGRLKDMVKRGGLNVYPKEIEDIILQHPAIDQAAVYGVPDRKWGEIVVAEVHVREGFEFPGEDELKALVARNLADFKVPATIESVETFPLTTNGKIQKFALREAYARRHGRT